MTARKTKTHRFAVTLGPDDDPASYAAGYPYITEDGETEKQARENALIHLDEGEALGQTLEVN